MLEHVRLMILDLTRGVSILPKGAKCFALDQLGMLWLTRSKFRTDFCVVGEHTTAIWLTVVIRTRLP